MHCVYHAASGPEAHILKGRLVAAGIPAVVQGEQLVSLRMATGFTLSNLPSIWIARAEDRPRAEELIAEFEAEAAAARAGTDAPAAAGPPWRCPGCREEIEPQFGECWNCGQPRPE